MNKRTINSCLPWQEIITASRHKEAPWKDVSTSILSGIQSLDLDSEDLGKGDILPLDTFERIAQVFDEALRETDQQDYYLRMCMRFCIFQNVVGILLHQVTKMSQGQEAEQQALTQLAHASMLASVRQIPFTIEVWQGMEEQLEPELRPYYETILNRVEGSIMTISGNTVYSFFEDSCSRQEVDRLLQAAYKAVSVSDKERQFSSRHGNGHSKLILQYVVLWQDNCRLKQLPRIMPFLRSLEAHWHHEFKLGCRQGVERMYAKKTMFAD